jgi:pimeloyl-ACP methyl ester carboxylesterase
MTHVEDIVYIIDQMGHGKAVVVGHSMGGLVVL